MDVGCAVDMMLVGFLVEKLVFPTCVTSSTGSNVFLQPWNYAGK